MKLCPQTDSDSAKDSPIQNNIARLLFIPYVLCLQSCASLYPTLTDPVEWWAVNGWSSAVTIEIYDNNCRRPLRDIRLKQKQEVKVVSCGDGSGQANIKYRREGYSLRQGSWGPDTLLKANQSAVVR